MFLYTDGSDGERLLSDLLLNGWNARRGVANASVSSLHVFCYDLHVLLFLDEVNNQTNFACFYLRKALCLHHQLPLLHLEPRKMKRRNLVI